LFERGPVRGLIRRKASTDRIDAEGKQAIEFTIGVGRWQESPTQQVPVERFKMSNIENNPVPLRDRTLVQRIGSNDTEKGIGMMPRFP
jgi:hypothetical protein